MKQWAVETASNKGLGFLESLFLSQQGPGIEVLCSLTLLFSLAFFYSSFYRRRTRTLAAFPTRIVCGIFVPKVHSFASVLLCEAVYCTAESFGNGNKDLTAASL